MDGYLKSGSITSISLAKDPAVAPVTVLGWLSGSGTKGMRLFVIERRADAGELDAGVGELVRDPDVGGPSGEHPDAAADLLHVVAAEIPVEAGARRPLQIVRHHFGAVAEERLGLRIRDWLRRILRSVEPEAVGQRHVRLDPPLIAHVRAKLVHAEAGGLLRIARRREAVVELLREPLLEQIEVAELVGAEVVADEEVPQLQELVVRPDRQGVAPLEHRVGVVQLDDVLIDRVASGELLGARHRGQPGRQRHGDLRECRRRVPVIPHARVGHAELVHAGPERRVQLTDGRVRVADVAVERVGHAVGRERPRADVVQRVDVVVAHGELVRSAQVEVAAPEDLVAVGSADKFFLRIRSGAVAVAAAEDVEEPIDERLRCRNAGRCCPPTRRSADPCARSRRLRRRTRGFARSGRRGCRPSGLSLNVDTGRSSTPSPTQSWLRPK